MKVEIVAMGKLKDRNCKALIGEYLERLGHYVRVEHTELKESKERVEAVRLAEEAARMSGRCGPHTVRVAMDERGRAPTSEEFAAWCERWMVHGTRHVAFFIGSASGLDEGFRQGCDEVFALSAMTLPHELARVVLAEQLYRAMTILRGEPYHK